MNHFSWHN